LSPVQPPFGFLVQPPLGSEVGFNRHFGFLVQLLLVPWFNCRLASLVQLPLFSLPGSTKLIHMRTDFVTQHFVSCPSGVCLAQVIQFPIRPSLILY
jgi:hypothetical protein